MAAVPTFRLNRDIRLEREEISEDEFCVVIDDFLEDPNAIVEFAACHRPDFRRLSSGYPGLQLPLAGEATDSILRLIRSRMSKLYPFRRAGLRLKSYLSIVTQAPGDLSVMQRICHIDPNPDPRRVKYAGLCYLFEDERLGGTSFFRWRDEELMWRAADAVRDDPVKGLEFLQKHFETFREPPRYMTESNDIAERLCTIPPRYNRIVFYSGNVPHSGAITAPELLSDDPRAGRLTLNLFLSAIPV